MKLEHGSKLTEIGPIPEDWETKRLKEIAPIATGNTPPTNDATNYGDEFLFVGPVDMGDSKFITTTEKMLSKKGFAKSRQFPEGAILFVCIGSTIGKCGIAATKLTSNQQINAIFPSTNFSNEFLFYAVSFAAPRIKAQAGEQAVPLVNKTQFSETLIAVPPLREQRAIAQALSDVDALIATLDRLIAKKRDIKQATMQQLLTGKTRLPGFSGKWNVKALGELGTISGGGVDKKIKPGEVKVRLVNYMDVYRRNLIRSVELEHVVSAPPDQASRCAVRKGDVFFTPSSEMPYDIAASAVAAEDIPDACYSYHVARLRLHEEWDIPFRAYAFKTQAFLDQAAKTCEGSGVRYVITQGKFRQLTLKYPADRSEQAAIATVLSDMDAELSALEARRDKTRALKQGMMQELLTGKTRLI